MPTKDEILSNHEYDVHYYGGGRRHILAAMDIYAKQQCLLFGKFLTTTILDKTSNVHKELKTDEQLYNLFLERKNK